MQTNTNNINKTEGKTNWASFFF